MYLKFSTLTNAQNGGTLMVQIDEKVYGNSKERLELLFDAGTFVELGAYTRRSADVEEFEGVVCGYGAVDGQLVFAFAQDSGRTKGAFGERHAQKPECIHWLSRTAHPSLEYLIARER